MTYSMYVCDACGGNFFEPDKHTENEGGEFWGDPSPWPQEYLACPACGREDIREVVECEDCGLAAALDGYDVCGPCQMKREEAYRLECVLLDIARAGAGA